MLHYDIIFGLFSKNFMGGIFAGSFSPKVFVLVNIGEICSFVWSENLWPRSTSYKGDGTRHSSVKIDGKTEQMKGKMQWCPADVVLAAQLKSFW